MVEITSIIFAAGLVHAFRICLRLNAFSSDGCIFMSRNSGITKSRWEMASDFSFGLRSSSYSGKSQSGLC